MRVFMSVVLLALAAPSAFALWAPVPLEILVDESDLIVAGKVAKVQNGGFALNGRNQDVAIVEVSAVLKALPHVGMPKEVKIGQPAAGGLAVSTDVQFQAGAEGVWLLTKDPERDVYWARHPFQFQEAAKRKELVGLIAAREKLSGGMAVKGLQARAELLEHKPAKGTPSYEVRFSLKNTSDKPLTVCDYVGNQPLQVQWTGPDGQMLKSNHYDWLALARLRGLEKENFATIPTGGVRFLGPRSKDYGILFQAKAPPSSNVAATGQHRVTVSYVSKEQGKQFGLENVWTGTAASGEVAFTVK